MGFADTRRAKVHKAILAKYLCITFVARVRRDFGVAVAAYNLCSITRIHLIDFPIDQVPRAQYLFDAVTILHREADIDPLGFQGGDEDAIPFGAVAV